MSKTVMDQTGEIVVAMIEKGLIQPTAAGREWTTEDYANEVAAAIRIVWAAVNSPRGS